MNVKQIVNRAFMQIGDTSQETLLVDYIVYRVMNMDITGITANMVNALQAINSGLGENDCIIAEGYWDYGCKRTDYSG